MKLSAYISFAHDLLFTRYKFVTEKHRSIFDIDYSRDVKKCKLIIFDFDDTLSDHTGVITRKTEDLMRSLQDQGLKLAVFSNCTKKRTKFLDNLLSRYRIYNVARSDKPDKAGYEEVMTAYHITPERTMMVGDRLGTDIYGGYKADIRFRIQVEPYSYVFGGNQVHIILKVVRKLENLIYEATRR